ncbi:hypothetical protein BpHYR1_006669 [Brachionus plicatilis]|uniref:Uncharacterized protein n=1 Tax=Brachionus plicatilis TaxID=10195 RepID=A0A3M7QNX1_BRAPC|nr:hypothetical protein BpHYR1_006669 [Brachionus plicatilis]
MNQMPKESKMDACKNSTHQKSEKKAPCVNRREKVLLGKLFFKRSGHGFLGQEIRSEVVNPGPQEPTIRLLNFDLEILMLIPGEI